VRATGKVNLIAVVIVAAMAGAIYWTVMFSGVYLDNMDIKTEVVGAYNEAGRKLDPQLMARILDRANHVGTHKEDDGYGRIVEKKGLGLTDENVTIERDDVQKRILIRVEYDREVQLKPLQKIRRVHFNVSKEGPINP
jgi:hypothetical protein